MSVTAVKRPLGTKILLGAIPGGGVKVPAEHPGC